MTVLKPAPGSLRTSRLYKCVRWTVCALLLLVALLWLADRIWPLPLPKDDLARVVLAEDGTPLGALPMPTACGVTRSATIRCRRITSKRC